MKITITLFLTIIAASIINSINCQELTIPLFNWDGDESDNVYYKDMDAQLNDFEGTWLYTNGNTSLKLVLQKITMHFNGRCYQDIIIGEYQYIENGVEKVNTLQDLANPNVSVDDHYIDGNDLHDNCGLHPTSDCIEGELRLFLGIVDPNNPYIGVVSLHKRIINNTPALNAYIGFEYSDGAIEEDEIKPEPSMPYGGEYLLIKQD
ncbi:hypothetical protein J4050_14170 [Winogradskyella sp. DF17]|jgi:hypothetical protein|uniref:DUF6705 domain-containing protein n=1 Tax=Winogradskyella pelagia TaxID=2819984 RepID=A0ABS3T571_9FLAO|nr:DUF6705 family protein [Winogradskyella sp. DF17]MBO3117898.1 hypothetical protein [Winogradskyella sp. DF17]